MRIPPAWTHVWISPIRTGTSSRPDVTRRARKQYRYHPSFRAVRDATKYHRMGVFGAALPELRLHIDADLSREGYRGRRCSRPLCGSWTRR